MKWRVPYIDYPRQYARIRERLLARIDEVLSRGNVMLREELRDFESHLAARVGTRYAIGTSNCTDALHLTLRAAGIGAGDEVITVSHTFVATAAAIHHTGARPVLVDIADDHNIDVELVEAAITPRTRAILPVHLNGRVSDMRRLLEIAGRHDLAVIEDSAQALGASCDGVQGGASGLAGCFSFYPAKLLGTYGDAGAVTTDDETIAERVLLLRNHGRLPDGDLDGWAFNCRMDNLHAAILDLKLAEFDDAVRRRRELAAIYSERLAGIEGLLLPPAPTEDGRWFDVFQNYEIECDRRDALRDELTAEGVETLLPWGGRGVHQFPRLGLGELRLPRTQLLFERALMLPLHPELDDDQVEHVCEVVRDFCATSQPAT